MDQRTESLERMITVEQQLKFQNEKLELMMQQSDKRFDQMLHTMDKRFEQVDKRFSQMFWFGSINFIALGLRVCSRTLAVNYISRSAASSMP